MFDRTCSEFGGGVRQILLLTIRCPRLTVIHRKRAKHFSFARHNRRRPARCDSDRPRKISVFIPEWIRGDVRYDYRLASVHGRPTRAVLWSDWTTIDYLDVVCGQTRCERMPNVITVITD